MHKLKQFFIISILVLVASFSRAHQVENPEKYVTQTLTISGEVKNKLELSIKDLKQMTSQTLKDVPIISKHGTKVIKSLKGVLLKDVLDKAEIVSKSPGDSKKMYIVVSASDGYKAIFSWNEVFNSPLSEGILVAYEKDKAELGVGEGRLLLLSSKDFMTGSRHVRWLKSVEVRKITD